MRRTGGLRRRLLAGIGTLTVLFLAVLVVMLVAIRELRATDEAARATASVVVANARAQAALQELEPVLRDYVAAPTAVNREQLRQQIALLERRLVRAERTLVDGETDSEAAIAASELASPSVSVRSALASRRSSSATCRLSRSRLRAVGAAT